MTATRSVVLLVAVALVGLTVAPAASGAFAGAIGADSTTEQPDEEEVAPGQSVSTFMQSSAADTSNTVESEMFEAKYEDADNETRKTLVDERADGLEATLESLENERDELQEQEDELSEPQYQARMTRLTVEITALERSVEQTQPFALDTDVGLDRLESIRENAAELSGEQIADIAKQLVGFDDYLDSAPFSDQLPGDDEEDDERSTPDEPDDEAPGEPEDGDTELGEEDDGNESVNDGDNTTSGDNDTPTREEGELPTNDEDDGDDSDEDDGDEDDGDEDDE
ncbi:hypothetical protein CV102_00340 [Natronococcus pandeyae]|uniref:Uncharacterized protein n=1 Tax=Natronococcus pandeyae TaxID=2055836 RepID=A0A8J8Q650_9EURY|nr:hypothetical protein [Natronococcus pandeyae]TYL40066.1 hypothetical protein CV102_00340 [Natronococcus pandeyae]